MLLLIRLLSYITVVGEESNVSTVVNGNIANQENKTLDIREAPFELPVLQQEPSGTPAKTARKTILTS